MGWSFPTYTQEAPGMSAFALDDGVAYHTYSAYARGWTACGTCTNGSTGHCERATRNGAPTPRSTGSVATTSTTTRNALTGS
jgi:hypothetical protein